MKDLIKISLFKLHHIHKQRGVLRTPSIVEGRNFWKNSQRLSVDNYICKRLHSESGRVPNTFYKIVVRKLPICKLKEKTAKKLKLNFTTLLKG